MTVVKAWVIGTAILLAPVMASAQVPRQADAETIRARQKISLVEGSFERAVQNAADNFSRQVQAVAPGADGMAMLLGAPVVRGFRQRQGGIFFDVLMPSLQLSMTWPMRYSQGADPATLAALADVRNSLERSVADPQERQALTQKLRQLELQMSPASAARRRAGPTAVSNVQAATTTAPPVAPVESGIMDDPAEAWRTEVRGVLIDAILDNSGSVSVGPDDYITVAARGVVSPDRLMTDPGESRTIELSLKGSDLDAYRSKAITLEEARKRVGIREY